MPLTRRYHLPSALRPSALRIEPEEARALAEGGAVLVDVRRNDRRLVPLDGALRIAPDEIPRRLGELSREVPIILACT